MTIQQNSDVPGPRLHSAPPAHESGPEFDNNLWTTGNRIEVRWEIEEEDAEPCIKWWGATVLGAEGSTGAIIKIRYDASSGFEAEEVQVEILSPEYLRHVDTTETLRWKREGAHCEESDAEEHLFDGVLSLKDLTDEQAELERASEPEQGSRVCAACMVEVGRVPCKAELLIMIHSFNGRTMEEAAMQQLSQNLQPAQQAEVVSRFMDFAEHFKGHLQQLVQEDQNHVITAEEIQTIAQEFGRH